MAVQMELFRLYAASFAGTEIGYVDCKLGFITGSAYNAARILNVLADFGIAYLALQ